MSGAAIASKVRQGLLKALAATGPAVSAEIVRRGDQSGPAHNPTPGADTAYSCDAFAAKIRQGDLSPSLIETVDRKFLVAADGLEVEPTTSDRLRLGSTTQRILAVEAVAPAGIPVLWRVYVSGPDS